MLWLSIKRYARSGILLCLYKNKNEASRYVVLFLCFICWDDKCDNSDNTSIQIRTRKSYVYTYCCPWCHLSSFVGYFHKQQELQEISKRKKKDPNWFRISGGFTFSRKHLKCWATSWIKLDTSSGITKWRAKET